MSARRRKWSERGARQSEVKERYWRAHVSQQARGGLSIRGYCRQHALAEPSFYAWRRELARRDQAQAKANARTSTPDIAVAPTPTSLDFVRLDVRPEFTGVASPIEIVLPNELRVLVPPRTGRNALREVLAALGVVSDAEPLQC